jgi:magnesium transporter
VIAASQRASAAERLWEDWTTLSVKERVGRFKRLTRTQSERFFLALDSIEQTGLLRALSQAERRLWLRLLDPDEAADLMQHAPEEERAQLFEQLDEHTRAEVRVLMAYAEDAAGGLMNPRFVRIRAELSSEEAIRYLRKQAPALESIYYAYVLDQDQRLLGVLSLRHLLNAPSDRSVRDIMNTEVVTVQEDLDQEAVARIWREHDFLALPVVDGDGHMKGIITYDDIAAVLREEATEDIQKFAGMEALGMRYLATPFGELVRKRGGWLVLLFLGEMLTASAMAFYEADIAAAVVLALFVPLIISSGGNAGSQASTLVVRSMALGEVHQTDWWRVLRRETATGLALGILLAVIGLLRILVWQAAGGMYGEHYLRLGAAVALSLIGVVLWGSVAGAMLPFALRRAGFDPAGASAPLVATVVDVTGLIIYFSAAGLFLRGTLLP